MNISEINFEIGNIIAPSTVKFLNERSFSGYRIAEIPIGKIHRYLDGKVFSLYKTEPWALLNNREDKAEREKYTQYCIRAKIDNPDRSLDYFIKLISDVEEYKFDISPIIVDQNLCVIDGQHRSCIILNKYGDKYKVKVLMVYFDDLKYFGIGQKFRNHIYKIKKFFGMDV